MNDELRLDAREGFGDACLLVLPVLRSSLFPLLVIALFVYLWLKW